MSHMLTVLLSVADAQPPISDRIANNNLFFSCIEIMLQSLAVPIAMRYKLKDWQAASMIATIGIMAIIGYIIFSYPSISITGIIIQSMPLLAVLVWAFSAWHFRRSLNKDVSMQCSELRNDLKKAQGLIVTLSLQIEAVGEIIKPDALALEGLIIKGANDHIYKVKNGRKCWILNPIVFQKHSFKNEEIKHLPDSILQKLDTGEDIT